MPLERDLSDLPRERQTRAGEPPDPEPRFTHLLAQHWMEQREAEGERPTAHGTRLRYSDAGSCARALGLKAAGVEPSDELDHAAIWRFGIGTMLHDALQAVLQGKYGDQAEVEAKSQVDDLSGHADAVILLADPTNDGGTHPGLRRILYEYKTDGGFAYKLRVGDKRDPEGPSHSHKLQAALNAVALDCDEVVIGYTALDVISKQAAQRNGIDDWTRFVAEWSYTRDEFEPWAEAERKRLARILELVDEGKLPPTAIPDPEIPNGALIVDPEKGRWELHEGPPSSRGVAATGTTWRCKYCPFQQACAEINDPNTTAIPNREEAA